MSDKTALQSGPAARQRVGAAPIGGAAGFPERWRCPVARATALFSDRWASPILFALEAAGDGGERSERLRRGLEPISRKVFTETIRALERNGFVDRDEAPTVPPQVTYRITPLGRDLLAFLRTLVAWHEQHDEAIEDARARFETA